MILILTDKNDIHADILIQKLQNESVNYFRFDLDTFSLEKTKVSFENYEWIIDIEEDQINLKDISCIWNRKTFVQLMLDEQNKGYEFNIWKNEWNKTLLGIYYYLKDRKWVNYYRDNHKAENKYYQLNLAHDIGFKIPKYILSNQKGKLLNFITLYDKVVMKLMNQDFYKVGENNFMGFYVNIITKEDLLNFAE